MNNRKFVPNIELEDAEILRGRFLNFSGRPSRYNAEGNRNFCVVIPDADTAQELQADGWNVRLLEPRDEGDAPKYYLQVTVGFKVRPPKIVLIKRGRQVEIGEDEISMLDDADIRSMDMTIRPRFYEKDDGSIGVKAYLKSMYVVLEEDRFAAKYAMNEHPEE